MTNLVAGYTELIKEGLARLIQNDKPEGLYQPIQYLMELGGKRIRPAITLMTAEAYDVPSEQAMPVALALEVFHNFTLMHDDIMDNAPLRRNQQTVHEKWDINTAILSGDGMMILAYQLLEKVDDKQYKAIMQLFNKTAIEVCEGQQFDMDFETMDNVEEEAYLNMIRLKTSVLVAACFQMGALLGNCPEHVQQSWYKFGEQLGLAFQLKDDWLDLFGDQEKVGKQVGGDVVANKKTYMLIHALKTANPQQKNELVSWLNTSDNNEEKVHAVKKLFIELGTDKAILHKVEEYYKKALKELDTINLSDDRQEVFISFAAKLMGRKF